MYFTYITAASAPIHAFLEVFFTNTLHNILSKPLAAFLYNHCRNNRQQTWERNELCRNDYQSSERILAEPGTEQATSCSQVCNATDWAMGLGLSKESGLLWSKYKDKSYSWEKKHLFRLEITFIFQQGF